MLQRCQMKIVGWISPGSGSSRMIGTHARQTGSPPGRKKSWWQGCCGVSWSNGVGHLQHCTTVVVADRRQGEEATRRNAGGPTTVRSWAYSSSSSQSPTGPRPSPEGNRPRAATVLASIPAPTWSMTDHLPLGVRQQPLPLDQWHALCRRAGVWPGSAEEENDNNNNLQLRQNLGNWMHLVEQVLHFREEEEEGSDDGAANGPTTTLPRSSPLVDDSDAAVRWTYDLPRGLDGIHPMGDTGNDDENEDDSEHESLVSDRVRESLLRHRAVQLGGHSYFAVRTTAVDENNNTRRSEPHQPPQQ